MVGGSSGGSSEKDDGEGRTWLARSQGRCVMSEHDRSRLVFVCGIILDLCNDPEVTSVCQHGLRCASSSRSRLSPRAAGAHLLAGGEHMYVLHIWLRSSPLRSGMIRILNLLVASCLHFGIGKASDTPTLGRNRRSMVEHQYDLADIGRPWPTPFPNRPMFAESGANLGSRSSLSTIAGPAAAANTKFCHHVIVAAAGIPGAHTYL